MKKTGIIAILAAALCLLFTVNVRAVDEYADELKGEYASKLFDELSDEAKTLLEESGFDSFDFEKILNTSPSDIFNFFINSISGKIQGPLKNLARVCSVVILTSVVYTYIHDDEKKKSIFTMASCALTAVIISPSMVSLLKAGASAIDVSCKFMFAFLPILAGLIAACSNPVLAVSYNSITLYLAQIIASFADYILVPFMGIYYSLSTVGCLSGEINLNTLARAVNKTVTKTLSVMSSIFVGFLSLKGILANTADTVTSKGAKLIVGSVPIIGGALSEAYGAVVGSLSLLKSTVGIFGIIAIAAVNLPLIMELTLWSLSFKAACVLSDVMELETMSKYFSCVSDTIKTLNIILIFTCMLFIVSTGILLTIRSVV